MASQLSRFRRRAFGVEPPLGWMLAARLRACMHRVWASSVPAGRQHKYMIVIRWHTMLRHYDACACLPACVLAELQVSSRTSYVAPQCMFLVTTSIPQ